MKVIAGIILVVILLVFTWYVTIPLVKRDITYITNDQKTNK